MGSSQKAQDTTSPWKPAQGALKDILSQAGMIYDKNGGINAEWIDKQIADLTPEMQAIVKDMLASEDFHNIANQVQNATASGMSGIDAANQALTGLSSGQGAITSDQILQMSKDLYQSDLVQSQKEQLASDVQKSLSGQIQQLNQQAAASGNMGSSRAGVAEGVATGEAAKAIAQGQASIENSAIQNAITQAMGTLQGNQSLQLNATNALGTLGIQSTAAYSDTAKLYETILQNRVNASTFGQNYQQSILDNNYMNAVGAQNAGWNNLLQYLQIAGSIGGTGSVVTTGSTAAQNMAAAGNVASGVGGIMQGISSFSDVRFKKNLKLVQEEQTGHDAEGNELPVPALYTWEWNDIAKDFFAKEGFTEMPAEFGVIAQELEDMGLGEFVIPCECDIEGFGGVCRIVNYPALYEYAKLAGVVKNGDVQA